MKISEKIKKRLEAANKRYWANDNISEFIENDEKERLKIEAVDRNEKIKLLIEQIRKVTQKEQQIKNEMNEELELEV